MWQMCVGGIFGARPEYLMLGCNTTPPFAHIIDILAILAQKRHISYVCEKFQTYGPMCQRNKCFCSRSVNIKEHAKNHIVSLSVINLVLQLEVRPRRGPWTSSWFIYQLVVTVICNFAGLPASFSSCSSHELWKKWVVFGKDAFSLQQA